MRVAIGLAMAAMLAAGRSAGAALAPRAIDAPQRATPQTAASAVAPTAESLARAATDKAVADLYRQIERLPVGSDINAGQLLKVLDAEGNMWHLLQRAEQVGGPRWIDEKTVQVQLEVSGERVGHALRQAVFANPRKSPVSFQQIQQATARWADRNFSATGAVSCANTVPLAGVRFPGAWRTMGERERAAAVSAARESAVQNGVNSVRAVQITDTRTVGEMLSDRGTREIRSWLSSRPISQIDFREDMQVEVALAANPTDLFAVVRDALQRSDGAVLPKTDDDWKRVEQTFAARVSPPTGRWRAPSTLTTLELRPVAMPRTAPDWISGHLEGLGVATSAANKLKAGLAAEQDARARLQTSIEKLSLNSGLTIGEAAAKDPQVARALARALRQARVIKTIYPDAHSAQVKMVLDLRDVWDELRR